MKILVACEESQRVCAAFRERGHEAFSCDIEPCSGGRPDWHIQGDVLPLLNGNCTFETADTHTHTQGGPWDMVIAFPPCTYLTTTGNRWFDIERYGGAAIQRYKDRYKAIVFFMQMVAAHSPRVAVENPVGIMSTAYRRPDQIISPHQFGHSTAKKTCLWLKGLPPLIPTGWEEPEREAFGMSGAAYFARDEQGKILAWNDPETAKIRSKTYLGIAKAMAQQWG